ncbi:uncharacterized protein LOC127831542 isoform X2 [Dreissena polymorpha]|uniref:uncharacterized protein LOC127831542 isoform X2 n=1 Tax=Dreissena polymorpha TaxID=45954 RepID=UPI002265304D|nr:uncharacterized protein LOC127831542 isoform X2 [Dreissena polymorpha]
MPRVLGLLREAPHSAVWTYVLPELFRCLQQLARLTRSSKTRMPLDRLRIRCPSCRKNALARPILRRRAPVNYAIKELVEEWFNSAYSSGSVDVITLRSVSTQTDTNEPDSSTGSWSSTTESGSLLDSFNESSISDTEFREVLFHRIDCRNTFKTAYKEHTDNDEPVATENAEHLATDDTPATSSEESESENEIGALFGDIQVVNDNGPVPRMRFTRFRIATLTSVLTILFAEMRYVFEAIRSSRSRTILTIFWFLYGVAIVCISQAFLPWMLFYTIIYFVIIYAELAPRIVLH